MPAPRPAKARTENNSPTFSSSGDPCLDFFFHVVPDTPASSVTSLLADAWAAEPLTALRLACNLRGVRGTGKADRDGFYAAALWMQDTHPATLALNARAIADIGCLKDFPEILHRIVNGDGRFPRFSASRPRRAISREEALELKRLRREAAARAVERHARDQRYRFLHDRTADLFAEMLAEGMEKLAAGRLAELSLAAKWCPSLNSQYDCSTLLCEAISRRLFPEGSVPQLFASGSDEDVPGASYYAYRAHLRKTVLVPLRRALQLPEIFVAARAWGEVVYPRVASVAMRNYRDLFFEHDGERFGLYLDSVRARKAKIAAGALLPHQIIASVAYPYGSRDNEVAELQWWRTVDDLLALGSLSNCLAVCDVSGSMSGLPMNVCVALGLLLSELCDEPWRHCVITFSQRPQLHHVRGENLWEKTRSISRMQWDMNTDFQAVFDQLLRVAVAGNLPAERMVRKVFVFSDMKFDQASSRPWETDYEAITRKFAEAGYGDAVPQVVFWNLRDSRSVPVLAEQKGVALVSGFSKNMLKVFLDGGDAMSPRAVMEKAIAGPEYQKLVVFD
ncbi:uncharacterized protein LOC100843725 [Brachypodium distachyon]|uniref:uncharacterized protein LOC100843725 n=1 Tax=Brachypodium distachyon TaxID=15368 RepID=UPI0006E497D5|nr:uncharacterized protein LOC100843725 [Brachypodium distachyon]|eukprot:XP_024313204.1 uncharacterized protein LOC100843725 [Brachypodium distachyon]